MKYYNPMKYPILLLFISSFLFPASSFAIGEQNKNEKEITFDALKIEKNARLIDLLFNPQDNVITLNNIELIEDDAPAIGVPEKYFGTEYRKATAPWQEDLEKGVVVKKTIILNNPEAWSGRLLFLGEEVQGNTEPLHLSINGYQILRPASSICCPHAQQYSIYEWLRWYFVDLPVGALKEGSNEILMWTDSEMPTWKVCIALDEEFARGSLTRTHHPNLSSKSLDGGNTWDDSKLGIKNSEDGEYTIRLSLDRYVPAGEFVSPVIDITGNSEVIKRSISSLTSDFFIDIEVPEKTTATANIRFGTSPLLSDTSWTSWEEVATGVKITKKSGEKRYFQWKVKLATNNPLISPSIKGIKVYSEWKNNSPNKKLGVVATTIHNGQVITPSYNYKYEDLSHPELQKFRKKFKLDKIVAGAKSEFEVMMRLLHWSYRIPVRVNPYSWNGNDIAVYKKAEKGTQKPKTDRTKTDLWDWILLDPGDKSMPQLQWNYTGRRRDAMCNYSNLSLQAALMSMGYQARYININSEGTSGHEITEVWSNEFNKWIYMDATRDYYYFDPDTGLPLNLLEIHNKLADKIPRIEIWQRPFALGPEADVIPRIRIGMREGPNLFSVEEDGYKIIKWMSYFRIPLRNDFYSNPNPIPIAQGYSMWGWDGYLNHYDEKFPKRPEFQRQSNRFVDFYEPLNQAQIFLEETDQPGVLKVEVRTHTPGFMSLLVKSNNGEWTEQENTVWNWKLKPGMNKIEVRVITSEKVLGPVSCIKVTCNP